MTLSGRFGRTPDVSRHDNSQTYKQVACVRRRRETIFPETFVRRALSTGDQCFAILHDDGTLANYSWYTKTTNQFSPMLRLEFDSNWVYQYRAFTLPAHRGRRLHAIGMTRLGRLPGTQRPRPSDLRRRVEQGVDDIMPAHGVPHVRDDLLRRPSRLLGRRAPKAGLLARHIIYHSPRCRRFKFRLTCADAEVSDVSPPHRAMA
jgi:hypothetical protein